MIPDPPGGSYFEAILVAIRSAGRRITQLSGYLSSAEQANAPAWKWQLLVAAGRAHADALGCIDEAEERLAQLGGAGGLPPPLDQLPARLEAMRADLRAAEERIQKALHEAVSRPIGSA